MGNPPMNIVTANEFGFTVFPVDPYTKVPFEPWKRYQSERPTAEQILAWSESPETGKAYGIACGVVIVEDSDDAEAEAWAQENLPKTPWMVMTAKGVHRYYLAPQGAIISNRNGLTVDGKKLKLDRRAAGGFVLGPGSLHGKSGKTYLPTTKWSIEDWVKLPVYDPTWLPEQRPVATVHPLPVPTDRRHEQYRNYLAKMETPTEGRRNATVYQAACVGYDFGLSASEVLQELEAWNRSFISPLPDREVETTARSAERSRQAPLYPKGQAGPLSFVGVPERRSATAPPAGELADAQARATLPEPLWGVPTPLEVAPPPDFDLSIFHPTLADFAQALADETETPTSFAGNLILGLLGTIMAGAFVVRVKGGWFEEAFAWTITVGVPGEGKSPVMRPIILPLRAAERRWRDSSLPRISKQQAAHEYQGLVLKKALDELKKDPEDEELRRACDREREKLETLKVSTPPQLLFNDSTMEAVFRQAIENHGIGAYVSDEIGFLQRQQGGNTAGDSNIDLLLHGYDGQPYRNRRIKSGQSDIEAARIIICAMAQPGPFAKFVNDEHLREKGLPDRALISWPASLMGQKTFNKPAVPQELREKFEALVDDLLIRYKGVEGTRKPGGVFVNLSDDARTKILDFRRKMDRMAGEGGRYHAISGYVSKMAGKAVRLAALFYGSECAPDGVQVMPVEYVDRAIYLIESHYLPHAAKAFGIEPEEVDTVNARAILSKLIKKGSTAEPRDRIRRLTRLGSDALDAALDLLESYGWMKAEEKGTKGRPKVLYHLHPEADQWFGQSRESELDPPAKPSHPTPRSAPIERSDWEELQAEYLEGIV